MKDFKEKLALVPQLPGCYQMKDASGEIIYVGKAKVLQNRLKSYFTGSHSGKTKALVENIDDFEYIITSSELEAFLLEINLIKEYRPHYNIMLMDDKAYPYIYLTDEVHPRLLLTRDPAKFTKRAKGKLYGPYANAKACKDVVDVLNKAFPLRKCNNIPKKECLYYSLGQCLGPCINKIEKEEYTKIKQDIHAFLTQENSNLEHEIEKKMYAASEAQDFEKAISYRDILKSLEIIHDKQKMTSQDYGNRDVFGYYVEDGYISIQVFHIRYGKVIMRSGDLFECVDDIDEILSTYILEFYQIPSNVLPDEVVVPQIVDINLLESVIKTKIIKPAIGDKKKLVDLVCDNCKNNLKVKKQERLNRIKKTITTTEELGNILNIDYPKRIELFDNSNISGTSAVSAMVCYVDGVPSFKDYRKYIVKTIVGADDFHTMIEVITRRYKRLKEEGKPYPNLILVDGGAPQISAAKDALKQLGITEINLAGLVKDDNHHTRALVNDNLEEIAIDKRSDLFLLLEAMQNEVHRFAITYFRKTIAKSMTASILDNIKGVGKARKQKILESFDNLDDMKNASVEKYQSLGIPKDVAEKILVELNKGDNYDSN